MIIVDLWHFETGFPPELYLVLWVLSNSNLPQVQTIFGDNHIFLKLWRTCSYKNKLRSWGSQFFLKNSHMFSILSSDLDLILQKSPFLVQEMVSCVAQLIIMAKAGRSMLHHVNFLCFYSCKSSFFSLHIYLAGVYYDLPLLVFVIIVVQFCCYNNKLVKRKAKMFEWKCI